MNYYIVVFSVRSHTMQFNSIMLRHGVKCVVISTPRSASSVCGISVKIPESALILARQHAKHFSSFVGIFKAV